MTFHSRHYLIVIISKKGFRFEKKSLFELFKRRKRQRCRNFTYLNNNKLIQTIYLFKFVHITSDIFTTQTYMHAYIVFYALTQI